MNTEEKKVLTESLQDHYQTVLIKNHKYQMGDDDFQPTTEEMKIINALKVIIKDLNA